MLVRIQERTERRAGEIVEAYRPGEWPCRKGCSDCCRELASEPLISEAEWRLIDAALDVLPEAALVRERIRRGTGRVCPLLDEASGSCLVYEARPIACRAHGFYAERDRVLGCWRIAAIAEAAPHVVWGNYAALGLALSEARSMRDHEASVRGT